MDDGPQRGPRSDYQAPANGHRRRLSNVSNGGDFTRPEQYDNGSLRPPPVRQADSVPSAPTGLSLADRISEGPRISDGPRFTHGGNASQPFPPPPPPAGLTAVPPTPPFPPQGPKAPPADRNGHAQTGAPFAPPAPAPAPPPQPTSPPKTAAELQQMLFYTSGAPPEAPPAPTPSEARSGGPARGTFQPRGGHHAHGGREDFRPPRAQWQEGGDADARRSLAERLEMPPPLLERMSAGPPPVAEGGKEYVRDGPYNGSSYEGPRSYGSGEYRGRGRGRGGYVRGTGEYRGRAPRGGRGGYNQGGYVEAQ
jgi:hypothetical protein